MQSIPVFLDITKVADFRWKNGVVSRTHGVCHMIYIFLGSFFHHRRICMTDFRMAHHEQGQTFFILPEYIFIFSSEWWGLISTVSSSALWTYFHDSIMRTFFCFNFAKLIFFVFNSFLFVFLVYFFCFEVENWNSLSIHYFSRLHDFSWKLYTE